MIFKDYCNQMKYGLLNTLNPKIEGLKKPSKEALGRSKPLQAKV
jgi:hypothetical protein